MPVKGLFNPVDPGHAPVATYRSGIPLYIYALVSGRESDSGPRPRNRSASAQATIPASLRPRQFVTHSFRAPASGLASPLCPQCAQGGRLTQFPVRRPQRDHGGPGQTPFSSAAAPVPLRCRVGLHLASTVALFRLTRGPTSPIKSRRPLCIHAPGSIFCAEPRCLCGDSAARIPPGCFRMSEPSFSPTPRARPSRFPPGLLPAPRRRPFPAMRRSRLKLPPFASSRRSG